jgi:hypothetical protein
MVRALIGAVVGVACAVLLIAGLAAWDGYVNGMDTYRLPPGTNAAVNNAFFCVMYFWPIPTACGAVIGALAGFGSWLVRPRRDGAARS